MKLEYSKFELNISFESTIEFKTLPTFIFHSVLGKELRRLTCLFKTRECSDCPIKNTCPYSVFFVTPIDKNNEIIRGRDKGPHPYVISVYPFKKDENTKSITLTFTIFGKLIDYFPYVYYSIIKAGQRGVFKNRIKYEVKDVKVNGVSILKEDGNLSMDFERNVWSVDKKDNRPSDYTLKVTFLSPTRIKYRGSFLSDISFNDLINSGVRRVEFISKLYGSYDDGINSLDYDVKVVEKNIQWKDYIYYSARQREKLKLGGVVGDIQFYGKVDSNTLAVLKTAELLHIGKNPSFGLGKIQIEV